MPDINHIDQGLERNALPTPAYGRATELAAGPRLRYTSSVIMPTSDLGKILVAVGLVVVIAGVLLLLWPRLPLPGRLPGDFSFHTGGVRVFIPIATTIVLSIILTVVINVVLRIFK